MYGKLCNSLSNAVQLIMYYIVMHIVLYNNAVYNTHCFM